MAELVYDETGRLLFTEEMAKEYTLVVPQMLPVTFRMLVKLLELERMVLDTAEYHFDDSCIILSVTEEMQNKTGCSGTDLEGIAVISRSVEGVKAGVTLKQVGDKTFKISLRTYPPLDASKICKKLGGGGHKGAAGATVEGTLEEVKALILCAVKEEMEI
ncbi:MAG: hypothetical protein IKY77_05045 [Methanocorpusculaceae archaeon]|nr:hypothetical protein [Methanocorpusculaceae archaeon]